MLLNRQLKETHIQMLHWCSNWTPMDVPHVKTEYFDRVAQLFLSPSETRIISKKEEIFFQISLPQNV